MSASAFSTADDVISRSIECKTIATAKDALFTVYEVDRCVSWIQQASYMRVALQFPDQLLVDAPAVATAIQNCLPKASVFILGDTSYGSCCVDEVGAQHYQADCVIHYGRACLSPTARLPVLYVFGRSPIDTQDCVDKIRAVLGEDTQLVLVYDTTYNFAADEIFTNLKPHFKHVSLSRLLDPSTGTASPESNNDQPLSPDSKNTCLSASLTPASNTLSESSTSTPSSAPSKPEVRTDTDSLCQEHEDDSSLSSTLTLGQSSATVCKCGRVISLPQGKSVEEYSFVFVGSSDSPALLNMMMTFNKCVFYTYDPAKACCQRESLNVNRALMKRYYLIERAKDASIVGIVAGTLGVARYADMINHLKRLVKKAGKKSYTFVVGKLNPAKLANFAEVDIYVLVACPESSVLDQAEFYRPVVSPLEMELACNKARAWTGEYSADFRELLPGAADFIEAPVLQESEPDVSLISNKIRTLGAREEPDGAEAPQQTVAVRSDLTVMANVAQNAGEFLTTRSWQGLERKLGETPVVKATEGQQGIAASYSHEPGS